MSPKLVRIHCLSALNIFLPSKELAAAGWSRRAFNGMNSTRNQRFCEKYLTTTRNNFMCVDAAHFEPDHCEVVMVLVESESALWDIT